MPLFLLLLFLWSPLCAEDSGFDDVLLIINFNNPHYDNIPFLKKYYGPYFKNIVFYGEEPADGVEQIKHQHGWFVHKAFKHAMQKWPAFRGYLCCQDDCIMNFWNYGRLDKDKIWFHTFWKASVQKLQHEWPWWNYPSGREAAAQARNKLPDEARQILNGNCGQLGLPYTWADFFYVPGKYRQGFIELSECACRPAVYIEMAIPLILLSLAPFNEMEKLNPQWGGTNLSLDLATFDPNSDWVHPVKLSQQKNRIFLRDLLKKRKLIHAIP